MFNLTCMVGDVHQTDNVCVGFIVSRGVYRLEGITLITLDIRDFLISNHRDVSFFVSTC